MDNTSGVRVWILPEGHKMIIDETVWNEMFVEELWLNSIIGENNANKEQGNKDV